MRCRSLRLTVPAAVRLFASVRPQLTPADFNSTKRPVITTTSHHCQGSAPLFQQAAKLTFTDFSQARRKATVRDLFDNADGGLTHRYNGIPRLADSQISKQRNRARSTPNQHFIHLGITSDRLTLRLPFTWLSNQRQ